MRKLKSIIVVLCVLSLVATFYVTETECAAKSIKVIGKATIKKGTILPALLIIENRTAPVFGEMRSFEDQAVYIVEILPPNPGVHRGGYIADSEGFAHDCRTHGKEVMGESKIIIPTEEVEKGNATIKIF